MTDPELELEVEVFRSGDYGPKGSYGETEIDAIAAAYDPARHEAPVTLDHAQSGPAHGWVKRLRRLGDRLVATLWKVSPALRDWLRAGAYRKCSVELYRSFHELRSPYLKAVSFLGAAAPEVKGLQPPVFTETGDESVSLLCETAPGTMIPAAGGTTPTASGAAAGASNQSRGVESAKGAAPESVSTGPVREPNNVAFTEPNSNSTPEPPEPARATRDPEETNRLVCAAFASLKRTGHFLPAWEKSGIESFGAALLELDDRSVCITKGGTTTEQTPWHWFLEFLGALPCQVAFGEFAAPDGDAPFDGDADWTAGIPAPSARSTLCPQSVELHRETVKYMNQHPGVAYAEALHAVARGE